jgi:alkyl hydroperoxide reductase subunit AhpF
MEKIVIKVVGAEAPCPKCIAVLTIAARVARKTNSEVEHIDIFSAEAKRLKVLVVPSIYVNDKLVAAGDVMSEDELEKIVARIGLAMDKVSEEHTQ